MRASERYEFLEELGRGAMGVVYRARDRTLGREVAVKVLRREGKANPRLLARMMREAWAIAKLEHPNIVRIHDVLDDGLVMEFVRGRPLDLGALPLAERLRALEDVARAIHLAHERGIVHRDLKPGNILREETGRVVVMDFGLAHLADARSRLTRSGAVLGTPSYMAPEQIRGERVDGRVDVYSLGVMLYEALAGRAPFAAITVGELTAKVLAEDPAPPAGVPKDLATICQRALAKDPRDRYRTARALAEDLASHRAGRGIAMRPLSTWMRLTRRRSVVLAGMVTGLLVGVAAVTASKLRRTREGVTEARSSLGEEIRRTSATCLEAALDLRRVGKADRMGEYASKVYEICDRVMREQPGLAEPYYLRGRMHRAMMEDKEALEDQERASAKDPAYAPALYERVVLVARLFRRRASELEDEELRREGRRLARAGAGEARPGMGWTLRSRQELAKADPRAGALMKKVEGDLERLRTLQADLTEGRQACAEGFRAWVADDCARIRPALMRAIAQDPHLEEAYETLAAHETEHKAYEEAIRWWTSGIEKDRGYIPHFVGRAETKMSWGSDKEARGEDPGVPYEGAIEDYGEALKLDPAGGEAWMRRGGVRVNWGVYKDHRGEDPGPYYEAAILDFGEALRLDPACDETWMRRGMTWMNWGLYKAGRGEDPGALYKAAIEDFGEALQLNSARDETWMRRGGARMNWGAYKVCRGENPTELYGAAIENFGEALRLNPARDETWMHRGVTRMNWAVYKAGRGEDPCELYQTAIEDYGEALRLNPACYETWMNRGLTRMNWGNARAGLGEDPRTRYWAAIEDLGEALKLNPASDAAWANRGLARMNLGIAAARRGEDPGPFFEEAIRDFGEALRLNAAGDETWMRRGVARSNWAAYKARGGGDPVALYEKAVEDLRKALAINPSRAGTWRSLGTAHFDWGGTLSSRQEPASDRYRAALQAFQEALRLNPTLEAELHPMIDECRRRVE